MFDKKAFFSAAQPKTFTETVDGFGEVTLKQLQISEVESAREQIKKNPALSFGLQLLVLSVVDDTGAQVFSDTDISDLRSASNKTVEALVTKALQINGFIKLDTEKNLQTTQTDASATA